MLNVNIVPCLQDNYSFVIHDTKTNIVAVIDPSEFRAIDSFIKKKFNDINHGFKRMKKNSPFSFVPFVLL